MSPQRPPRRRPPPRRSPRGRPAPRGRSSARGRPPPRRRRPPQSDRRNGRRRWYRHPAALLLTLPAAVLGFLAVVAFFYFFASVPLPDAIGVEPTVVYDHAGNEIAHLQAQASREDVELAELPDHVIDAALAAEDATFFRHPGVSVAGVVRAAFINLTRGEVTHGGSTISQQYIKNVTADADRTWARKMREAAMAVKLERRFSKQEILSFYLNSIYFGRGAYGIQAAARAYYGIDARDLDVAQAAMVVGVLPAPSTLDPAENPEGAERRYRYVLAQMVENGWLDPAEAGRLSAMPPEVQPKRSVQFRRAPHFLDMVERELEARLGAEQVYRSLRVTTTLNMGVQGAAEAAYSAFHPMEAHGAIVALDPGTGGVRALVGGKDYATDQLNLATVGLQSGTGRQAGSAYKPFALATWVEQGRSPESFFPAPAELTFSAEEIRQPHAWRVRNFGGSGYGEMSLREATWRSVNTVYAQLIVDVGWEETADLIRRAGVESEVHPVPSVVLGTQEVAPLELAEAYNTFAAGGIQREPFTILEVERDGQALYRASVQERRAFSEQVAWTVTDVLKGVISNGTGTAANIGRPAAGKTGTTQNFADAWFAGYTPHLTTVVWMGNRDGNDPMPDNPTGGGVPAQVWADFMGTALGGLPPDDFPAPTGDLEVTRPSPSPEPEPECPEGHIEVSRETDEDGEIHLVCAPEEVEEEPEDEPEEEPTPDPEETPAEEPLQPGEEPSPSPSPSPIPAPPPEEDEEGDTEGAGEEP